VIDRIIKSVYTTGKFFACWEEFKFYNALRSLHINCFCF